MAVDHTRAPDLAPGPRVDVPAPAELRTQQVRLPRDAFFGPAEHVPLVEAAGRVAAEMITPYPRGFPPYCPVNASRNRCCAVCPPGGRRA